MPVYSVEDDKVLMHPISSTEDFARLLASAPVDLDELELQSMSLEQDYLPVIHHFAPGIYMREGLLRAGGLIVGHEHATPHLNAMLTGRLTLSNGRELTAPMTFVAPPGRKCAVVHEDVAWFNIYATDEQDVGVLEATFLRKTEAALAQEAAQANEVTPEVQAALDDYFAMLEDIGLTGELVNSLSAYQEDRIPLPWGAYKFRTASSPIHGKGVFASANIAEGELIGMANLDGHRTVLGYGVNHSGNPNAKMVPSGHSISVVAIRPIKGNMGGRFGDEITVDYRESRKVALCLPR